MLDRDAGQHVPAFRCYSLNTPLSRKREAVLLTLGEEARPRRAGWLIPLCVCQTRKKRPLRQHGFHALVQSSSRNSSGDRLASRAMPPIVKALTGLFRGIVTMRWPSLITIYAFPDARF